MEITGNNAPCKTEFKDINIGEVFIYSGTYYMKVPKVIEVIDSVWDEREINRNAIVLEEDGIEYTWFDDIYEVIPVDELVIKRRGPNNENC